MSDVALLRILEDRIKTRIRDARSDLAIIETLIMQETSNGLTKVRTENNEVSGEEE